MKNRRRAVGLLNPIRDTNLRQEPGGRRDDTCDHGLSRSWKVEACETKKTQSSGPSIAPVGVKHRQSSGNRHYSACCHCWLLPSLPSDFTGTIAGNRHYSTGTTEGPLLCHAQHEAIERKRQQPKIENRAPSTHHKR